MAHEFEYETNCVGSGDGAAINAMTETAAAVSYRTFIRRCKGVLRLTSFRGPLGFGYETDPRLGLTLKNDWHVSYHKGRYKGRACYFLVHSAIEYIFTRPCDRSRESGEHDRVHREALPRKRKERRTL